MRASCVPACRTISQASYYLRPFRDWPSTSRSLSYCSTRTLQLLFKPLLIMPTGSSHLNSTLALLCAAGGVFGYVKAKSVPSLVAGLAFGAAYGAGAYLINSGDPASGHMCGLASSVLLTGAMGMRFAKTGKVMPAGVMATAGVLGSIYNLQKYQEWTS